MKKKLKWIEEDGERYLSLCEYEGKEVTTDTGTETDVSPEILADFGDAESAGCNEHSLNGVHRMLAAIMAKHIEYDKVRDIFLEMAQLGGLSGMGEKRRDKKLWKELKVDVPPKKWELPDRIEEKS